MAKIFRRVRQRLFASNKFTKYLLYAIGEILLVVIGILIALQVNNLNEKRKSDIKEHKHLVSVKNELENNLEIVTTEIDHLNRGIEGQKALISLINSDQDTVSEVELSRIISTSFSSVFELQYQDGTFKEQEG